MKKASTVPIPFILPLALLAVVAFAAAWMTTSALADEHENGDGEGDLIVMRNGDGESGYTVNAFLPQEITIRTGTTVRWVWPFAEPHSTTLEGSDPSVVTPSGTEFDGSGDLNSGIISPIPPFFSEELEWEVTFTAEGVFEFFCEIHTFQTMTVTVTDDEDVDVDTQASVDARADAYFDDAMDRLKSAVAEVLAAGPETETLADGTTLWTMLNGLAVEGGHDALQYIPSPITITAGDTIKWVNEYPVPHTVTFGQPDAPGDPFEMPSSTPGDAYDGSGFWHSGLMFGIPGAIPGAVQEFEMTFSTPGTYDYYCMLHGAIGHQGQVVVEEADEPEPTPVPTEAPAPTPTLAAPAPPATGTGASGSASAQTIALLGGLVLLVGLSVLAFRATRSGARQD